MPPEISQSLRRRRRILLSRPNSALQFRRPVRNFPAVHNPMTALVRHLSLNNNLHPRPSGFATITGAPTLGPGSGPPQPSPSNANIQPEVCLHSLGHTRLLPASTAMADNPGVGQGVYLDGSGVLLNAKLTNQPQTSVITYNGLVKSFGSEGLERRIEPNPSQGSVLTPLGYVSGHDASCISVQITKSTGASVVLLLIVIWKMDSFIDLEGRSFDLILCKDYLDISPDRIQAGFQNQTVPNIQGDGHNALTLGTNHFSNQLGNVNNSPLPDAIMRDQASGVVPGYIIPRYPAYAIPPATYFPDTGNNPAPGFTSPMPPVSMPGYPPQIGASDISSTSASNNFLTQAPAGGMRTPGLQSPQQWEGYSNGYDSLNSPAYSTAESYATPSIRDYMSSVGPSLDPDAQPSYANSYTDYESNHDGFSRS